jgi:hypothetical protein
MHAFMRTLAFDDVFGKIVLKKLLPVFHKFFIFVMCVIKCPFGFGFDLVWQDSFCLLAVQYSISMLYCFCF